LDEAVVVDGILGIQPQNIEPPDDVGPLEIMMLCPIVCPGCALGMFGISWCWSL
jgi:hypothetical protein